MVGGIQSPGISPSGSILPSRFDYIERRTILPSAVMSTATSPYPRKSVNSVVPSGSQITNSPDAQGP